MAEDRADDVANVRLDFSHGEEVVPQFVTHMTVQATPMEFILSFFQANPPLLSGDDDSQRKQLAELSSIRPRCLARVVVATPRMPQIISVLTEQWKTYQSTIKAAREVQKE